MSGGRFVSILWIWFAILKEILLHLERVILDFVPEEQSLWKGGRLSWLVLLQIAAAMYSQ